MRQEMKGIVGVTDKEAENRRNGVGETQKEGQSERKLPSGICLSVIKQSGLSPYGVNFTQVELPEGSPVK
jgi:hypothetical protein